MIEKIEGATPEFETAKSRNEIIREALSEGKVPMLPFEQHDLEVELLGHKATQTELTRLLGEAMTTTSETWHDNAQADAVTMQSSILVSQAEVVLAALRQRFIIPYEHDEHDKVSIGAVVNVLIGKFPETVFITGRQRSLPDSVQELVGEDTTPVNVQSPIGAAIFDQPVGVEAVYRVGERELNVSILSIEYPDLANL